MWVAVVVGKAGCGAVDKRVALAAEIRSTISAAAVALLTAVIVKTALPSLPFSVNTLSVLLIASLWLVIGWALQ